MKQLSHLLINTWHSHPVIQALTGIIVASLWGLGGFQSVRKRKTATGVSWFLIALAIFVIQIIGFIVDHAWSAAFLSGIGLLSAIAVLARYYNRPNNQEVD